MKLFSIVAVLTAVVAVSAKSCVKGGVYCGQSLLNRGNYRDHIKKVLVSVKQPTDEPHVQNSLFDCIDNGAIIYKKYCGKGCGGVGSTKADYCL